jgi:hypothetical protein
MKGGDIMCKIGDIIVVKEFKNEFGERIKKHSFVVINDSENYVEGLNYDMVTNMICSFHNKEHKKRKLKYKENLLIKKNSITGKYLNSKEGFIKADQLYYFNKNTIKFNIIGKLNKNVLNELLILISKLDNNEKVKNITTNLNVKVKN